MKQMFPCDEFTLFSSIVFFLFLWSRIHHRQTFIRYLRLFVHFIFFPSFFVFQKLKLIYAWINFITEYELRCEYKQSQNINYAFIWKTANAIIANITSNGKSNFYILLWQQKKSFFVCVLNRKIGERTVKWVFCVQSKDNILESLLFWLFFHLKELKVHKKKPNKKKTFLTLYIFLHHYIFVCTYTQSNSNGNKENDA